MYTTGQKFQAGNYTWPFPKGYQWCCRHLTCLIKKSIRMLEMMPKLVKRNIQSMIHIEFPMHCPFCQSAIITSGVSAVDWWLHSNSTSSSDSLRMSSPASMTKTHTHTYIMICHHYICRFLFLWFKEGEREGRRHAHMHAHAHTHACMHTRIQTLTHTHTHTHTHTRTHTHNSWNYWDYE